MNLKKLLAYLSAGVILVNFSSCGDDDEPPVVLNPSASKYILSNDSMSSSRTLDNDSVWILKGYVYVKDGQTLTIEAGTVIKSDVIDKGAIIVERGGKIMAEGTAAAPIVFTSGQPKGQRRPGDWGGIILLGKASTNRTSEPTIEGGVGRQYGGNDDHDNSGVMKYVRIEFAGIAAEPNSEINGLTFGAVGDGTTIENIMVSYGNDDAYEFFGGTVNCKNMIAWATSDDDFDFDFGYRGHIQFAISAKHPQFADAGDASNGIEADNDGSGSGATPNTKPVLSNFTFVGPNNRSNTQANHNFANRWRRNVNFLLNNSIMVGFQKGGFSMESAGTSDSYKNGVSEFKNNLVHAIADPFKAGSGSTMTAAEIQTKALSEGCVLLDSAGAAMLTNISSLTAPNFVPQSGSPALNKTPNFSNSLYTDFFNKSVTYYGAIGTTDWTSGWTEWDPNNKAY